MYTVSTQVTEAHHEALHEIHCREFNYFQKELSPLTFIETQLCYLLSKKIIALVRDTLALQNHRNKFSSVKCFALARAVLLVSGNGYFGNLSVKITTFMFAKWSNISTSTCQGRFETCLFLDFHGDWQKERMRIDYVKPRDPHALLELHGQEMLDSLSNSMEFANSFFFGMIFLNAATQRPFFVLFTKNCNLNVATFLAHLLKLAI